MRLLSAFGAAWLAVPGTAQEAGAPTVPATVAPGERIDPSLGIPDIDFSLDGETTTRAPVEEAPPEPQPTSSPTPRAAQPSPRAAAQPTRPDQSGPDRSVVEPSPAPSEEASGEPLPVPAQPTRAAASAIEPDSGEARSITRLLIGGIVLLLLALGGWLFLRHRDREEEPEAEILPAAPRRQSASPVGVPEAPKPRQEPAATDPRKPAFSVPLRTPAPATHTPPPAPRKVPLPKEPATAAAMFDAFGLPISAPAKPQPKPKPRPAPLRYDALGLPIRD